MTLDRFEPRSLPLSSAPALGRGEAHVWFMQIDGLPILDRQPAARRSDALRRRRIGQRFLLRLLLGAYLGVPGRDVELARSAAGKPELNEALRASGLNFNLSHAGALLAIAIAGDTPIGIDIEPSARPLRAAALARRWFSTEEANLVDRCSDEAGRTECLRRWSVREAVIKAQGGTIAEHLAQVRPSIDAPMRLERLPPGWKGPSDWDVREITGVQDILGFVAAPAPLRAVRGFSLALPDHRPN